MDGRCCYNRYVNYVGSLERRMFELDYWSERACTWLEVLCCWSFGSESRDFARDESSHLSFAPAVDVAKYSTYGGHPVIRADMSWVVLRLYIHHLYHDLLNYIRSYCSVSRRLAYMYCELRALHLAC